MPDNAVLDQPDNAVDTEAPPEEFDTPLPETDEDTTPEAVGEGETPDSGEQEDEEPSAWAGLTPAQIEQRVQEQLEAAKKDTEARIRESERRLREQADRERAESEAVQQRQHAVNVRRGMAVQTVMTGLAPAIKAAFDNGRDAPDPQQVQAVLGRAGQQVAVAVQREALDNLASVSASLWEERYKGVQYDAAHAHQFNHAFNTGDYPAAFRAMVAMVADAERAKVQAEAEAAAAAKVQATQSQEQKKRATGARPTRAGVPAGRASAASVLESARPGSAEYRRAYREKYGFDP